MKTEIIKSYAVVSVMSLAKLILGLLSQIVIAYYFGTSRQLDIYYVVFALPSLVIGISTALFSSSVIPQLTLIKDEPEKFSQAVSSLFLYAVVLSAAVSAAGILAGKTILVHTSNLSGDDVEIAGRLVWLIWLVAGFEAVNSFFVCLYYLRKKFVQPSVILLLPSIGTIGGAVLLSNRLGVSSLLAGWLLMDAFSCLILARTVFKQNGIRIGWLGLLDEHAAVFLKSLIPIALTIMPFTVLPLIDAYWASGLPEGSMSYLGYSTRIAVNLGSLVVSGLYVVILPFLSDNVKDNDMDLFMANLGNSIKAVLFTVVPISLFCFFFREPLLATLLQRGRFNAHSTSGVAAVLPFYLLGMTPMCVSTMLNRAYAARRWFRQIGVLSLVLVAVYFVSAGVLSHFFSYIGVGVAYAAYWLCFSFAAALVLERTIISHDLTGFGLKIAVNAVVSAGLSRWLSFELPFSSLGALIAGFLLSCFLFYVLNMYILKTREVLAMAKRLRVKAGQKKEVFLNRREKEV